MLKHFINQNDFMYSFNTHQNFFGAAIGSHIVNAWAAAEYHNYRRLVIGGRWIMTPITSDRSWSFYFDPFWNENVSLNVCAFYSDKVAPRRLIIILIQYAVNKCRGNNFMYFF